MKKYLSLLIISCTLFTVVMSYSMDIFAFGRLKKDRISGDPGMMWGAGIDAAWENFSFYAEILETNFSIGDINPLWPQKVKLFEDTYYPFGPSVLTFEIPELTISAGLQELNEGLGSEYPLFISANNIPYPSLTWEFSPFDWLTIKQDYLFLRNETDNPLTGENTQISKSVYYRNIAFKPFDFLTLGFEESVLFMGRDVDMYYLLSPFTYIMSQDIRSTKNAPWNDPINDNCMVGGYIEYNASPFRTFAEVLVDDWSWSQDEAGVRKIAWNTGVDLDFDENKFEFEFAGASKYTFHKTGKYPYQYVRYETMSELPIEYNMIGYKYGENNAAFSAKYSHSFENADIGLKYEFLTFGVRDPFSPLPPDWQQQSQFRWLDDPVLQRENAIRLTGTWRMTPKIALAGSIGVTFVDNEGLVENKSATYPNFDISARYTFNLNEEIVEKLRQGNFFEIDFF